MADFPEKGLLVIGDSTVERLHIPSLCGLPAFNAGLSSARSDQLRPMVASLLKGLRPRRVVIAVGANDLLQGREGWERDIAAIAPRGAIIVGITGQPSANRILADLARDRDGIFVEPIAPSLTDDGIHANAAGRAEWKRRIDRACDRLDAEHATVQP